MGAKEGRVLVSSYNSPLGARSSMDRIRVSEALDTGSIPVGRASLWYQARPLVALPNYREMASTKPG